MRIIPHYYGMKQFIRFTNPDTQAALVCWGKTVVEEESFFYVLADEDTRWFFEDKLHEVVEANLIVLEENTFDEELLKLRMQVRKHLLMERLKREIKMFVKQQKQ